MTRKSILAVPFLLLMSCTFQDRKSAMVDMSQIDKQHRDVAYAKISEAQKMDIYIPDGDTVFPLVIIVHGGAFRYGDKSDKNAWAKMLVKHGFVAATINYRLSDEALFPANIHDVKAAIRFLRANAGKYQIDPEQVGLWGASAGGNLVSLAGTSGDVAELEDLSLGNPDPSSSVQAVVNWFGPTDFIKMDEYFRESGLGEPSHSAADSPESLVLGEQITKVPESVAKANPETYISREDPFFLIQHGTHDNIVPVQQSEVFAQKLSNTIGEDKVTLILLKGAGHGGRQFDAEENLDNVLNFLNKTLKSSRKK